MTRSLDREFRGPQICCRNLSFSALSTRAVWQLSLYIPTEKHHFSTQAPPAQAKQHTLLQDVRSLLRGLPRPHRRNNNFVFSPYRTSHCRGILVNPPAYCCSLPFFQCTANDRIQGLLYIYIYMYISYARVYKYVYM